MRLRLDFSATVEMTNAGTAFVPDGSHTRTYVPYSYFHYYGISIPPLDSSVNLLRATATRAGENDKAGVAYGNGIKGLRLLRQGGEETGEGLG
jgi:hypothetical protein